MFNDKTYKLMKMAAKTTIQNDNKTSAQNAGIQGMKSALHDLNDN